MNLVVTAFLLVGIFYAFKGIGLLMASLEEIKTSIAALLGTVGQIDIRLDDVAARISALEAGKVVTQEDIDALAASLDAVKTAAAAVLSEASGLATPATEEPPVDVPTPVDPEQPVPVEE